MPKAKKPSPKAKTKPVTKPKGEQDRITHISRVVFEGYKSIDHLEIDLVKGLNIIIGPNGSGKSNFMSLLDSVLNWVSPFENRRTYENYNLAEVAMTSSDGKNLAWYTERKSRFINPLDKKQVHHSILSDVYIRERIFVDEKEILDFDSDKHTNQIELKSGGILNISSPKNISWVLFEMNIFFPNMVFIKYNIPTSDELIGISKPGEISFEKRSKSANLSSTNRTITSNMFSRLLFSYIVPLQNIPIKSINRNEILKILVLSDLLKQNLKKFSPIKDVRFSANINVYENENRSSIENIILEFFVNDSWIPWSYLSDGTKRLFYIISEISYFKDAIILIEEPELGVHPDQFHLIMNFLKEQAEDKQIIMSTHSPEALNILNEDELQNIVVTKYDKKKGTTMSHLNKKQVEKAKVYMKKVGFLSDYWLQSDLEG